MLKLASEVINMVQIFKHENLKTSRASQSLRETPCYVWLITGGYAGGMCDEMSIHGYTKTKKQAQKICRGSGFKGSGRMFWNNSNCREYREIIKIQEKSEWTK